MESPNNKYPLLNEFPKPDSVITFFKENRTAALAAIGVFALLSLAVLYFSFRPQKPPAPPVAIRPGVTIPAKQPTRILLPTLGPNDNKVIARVGEENIYLSDLNTELAAQPAGAYEDLKPMVMQKIASDSITLQAGAKQKLIVLDETIFDSPDKNYIKRVESVQSVIDAISQNTPRIQGSVISIWFYNNEPGPLGYEEGKKFAYEKITQLHKEVTDGIITIKEAGEKIKNDKTLSQVDASYFINAILNFNAQKNDKITLDEDFNKVLWSLPEGRVSDIYLLKDVDRNLNEKEALYVFGQVTKKTVNNNPVSFKDWHNNVKSDYEIKYY